MNGWFLIRIWSRLGHFDKWQRVNTDPLCGPKACNLFFKAKVVVSTVRLVHTFFYIYFVLFSNPFTSKSSNPNSVSIDLSFLLDHLLVRFVNIYPAMCYGIETSSSTQGCGSAFISSGSGSSILGWIPIRIQGFNDQKLKKITAEKKLIFVGSKTTIYLSLGLHKERPSYRRSLQLSKEATQHFKTWTLKKKCLIFF